MWATGGCLRGLVLMPRNQRFDRSRHSLDNLFYHENGFPPSGFAQWAPSSSGKLPNGTLRQSLLTMRIAAYAHQFDGGWEMPPLAEEADYRMKNMVMVYFRLGCHPRRRTAVVHQRIEAVKVKMTHNSVTDVMRNERHSRADRAPDPSGWSVAGPQTAIAQVGGIV
jgi:hypothetical protein